MLPDYQRSFVWKKPDADQFIESLLMNIPIPSLYVTETNDSKNRFAIVDGLQRLTTLKFFIIDKSFSGEKPKWRLSSQNDKWDKKTFDELTSDEQKLLLRSRIPVIEIINLNNTSREDVDSKFAIYHVFSRINKSGTKLSSQQIRNAIYNSENLLKLKDLAKQLYEEGLIKISPTNYKRAIHEEFVLRILNVVHQQNTNFQSENLKNPLYLQINLIAKRIAQIDQNSFNMQLQEIKKILKIVKENEISLNSENPNDAKKTTNPLVLESLVAAAIVFKPSDLKKFILDGIDELVKNISENPRNSLDSIFYNNTNKPEKVIGRFNIFSKNKNAKI